MKNDLEIYKLATVLLLLREVIKLRSKTDKSFQDILHITQAIKDIEAAIVLLQRERVIYEKENREI